ncbi:MAG: glycoside hydrolase [Planctomycetaceae bacterium]|nr:glycoside hydrolase [Planctomycetaceae bacterium]
MYNKSMMMKVTNFLICFLLFVYSVTASETVVLTESFEKQPNQWITLENGFNGKAGCFNGETSLAFNGNFKVTRFEMALAFNVKNLQDSGIDPPDWLPVFRVSGQWVPGSFQAALIKGKFALHFHNSGSKRIRIESPPLENEHWYKIQIILDTISHKASMFLDDKEIGSMEIDPEIHYLNINSPILGAINNPKGIAFKGLMDEFKLTLMVISPRESDDPRNINKGNRIPCELYCDQPYIVVLENGTWVCTMTTGQGHEGDKGQHVVATRSTDQGKTWGNLIDIEPVGDISASWVVPLLTPFGRIYGFYTYNGEGVKLGRDDTHGWYAYRYSDDGGLTWSKQYRIPMRRTACDTLEVNGKVVQMFWGICKPRIEGNEVYIPFTKLGKYFLEEGEGWIMHSNNILTEKEPEKVHWEMLPEGDHGIRHPEYGSVQEEHNLVPLDQKDSFMCVYRTTMGFPACSYSRDRCKSWNSPEAMIYATGRTIRHPRACPMVWKTGVGKYLFWCHNNGGKSFENRNPVWLCAGLERDGKIYWSQPEIAIYSDEPGLRMSYPDLIMKDGSYWISETQKEVARIHKIDNSMLEGVWKRLADELDSKNAPAVIKDGLLLETSNRKSAFPEISRDVLKQKGFSFDFVVDVPQGGFKNETALIDNRDVNGKGFAVLAKENGAYSLEVTGDSKEPHDLIRWTFDTALLTPGKHRVTIIVEAAPQLILSVVDGQYVDGNGKREFGWGRYFNAPNRLDGNGTISLIPEINVFRFYDRPLKTFEATTNQSVR